MSRVLFNTLSSLLFLLFAFPATAESVRGGDLVVEAPWARASIGTSRPSAAYITIRNEGSSADVLTGIETEISSMPEVHEIKTNDNVSTMSPAGLVEIPAKDAVKLAPGGLHIMLIGLQRALVEGERFPMTLIFEKAGRVNVSVPIYSLGASGPEE